MEAERREAAAKAQKETGIFQALEENKAPVTFENAHVAERRRECTGIIGRASHEQEKDTHLMGEHFGEFVSLSLKDKETLRKNQMQLKKEMENLPASSWTMTIAEHEK